MPNGLSFSPKTGAFYLRPDNQADVDLAVEIGMTFSTTANVYFTHDPYAALPLWERADDQAKAQLVDLWLEYEASRQKTSDENFPAPPGLEYMPFQRAGIRYVLDRKHALIGDEPGLGKTIQAIGVANACGMERVLVVCPASVRRNWRREIHEWSTLRRPTTYLIEKARDGVSPIANWTVVSYDLARTETIFKSLAKEAWDMVVLDEAHYLKTPEANRTRALFGGGEGLFHDSYVTRRAERILGLTGTPLPNRPRECYTLVRAMCHDAIDWISFDAFKHRYNPSFTWPGGGKEERFGRLPELHARLRCNLMIRRLKEDVLEDLPEKRYELTYLEETTATRKALQAERLLDIDPTDLEGANAEILGAVSTVRREMGEAKAPLVADHVAMLLDGGLEKIVVFGWHRSVLNLLGEKLGKHGLVRVDGQSTAVQKHRAVLRFMKDPNCRVFLGNLLAAGVGIDGLQKVCQHAVLAEASWVPGENEQAIGRLDRHGQKGSVLAQFLVVPGSFDERVLGTALQKLHVTDATLDRRK